MRLHCLTRRQLLRTSIDRVWEFFSQPRHLDRITPADLRFRLIGGAAETMHTGEILTFRLTPLFGVPVDWVTEITHVMAPQVFIDEQRFGPFRFWHHRHRFYELPDGVEMVDTVHYAMPMGPFGEWMNRLMVASRLEAIFDFRHDAVDAIFDSGGA